LILSSGTGTESDADSDSDAGGRERDTLTAMKAAIFDMDGLIIDSEPLWRLAERAAFAGVGLELNDDDCRRTTGLRSDEVIGYWFARHPWTGPSQDAVVQDLEIRVADLISARGVALPGVRDAIERLREAGQRLALASSSSHDLIRVVLDALEMEDTFEVRCSGGDELRGKPDPAVYLTTVKRLGLPAEECLAFEDSAAGVQAARAAGLYVIAVPAAADFDDPRFDTADLKLRSLTDFDLSRIDCV
jgi:HAD superfamily hydrolase (TIGR01509 family)